MDNTEEEVEAVESLDESLEEVPRTEEVSGDSDDLRTIPRSLVERVLVGLEGVSQQVAALGTQFHMLQDKVDHNQMDLQTQIQLLTIERTPTPEVCPDRYPLAGYRMDRNPDCASGTVITRPVIAEPTLASAHLVSGRTLGMHSATIPHNKALRVASSIPQ